MKKKVYQEPTTEVVMLQHECQILAGSVEARRESYGEANTATWGDEE